MNPRHQLSSALSARALRKDGPLVDVTLHPTCEDGTACEPVSGKALIDTGADRTAVDFTRLPENARRNGFFSAQGVTSESVPLPVYDMKMSFPGSKLDAVRLDNVAGTPHLRSQGLIALLGRDVLSQAQLGYDGPGGSFSLAAPGGETHVRSPSSGPLIAVGVSALVGAAVGAATSFLLTRPEKTAGGPAGDSATLLSVGVGVVTAIFAMIVSRPKTPHFVIPS